MGITCSKITNLSRKRKHGFRARVIKVENNNQARRKKGRHQLAV